MPNPRTVTEADPVLARLQRCRIPRPPVLVDHACLVLPPRSPADTTTRQVPRELCPITDIFKSLFRCLASCVLLPSPAHVGSLTDNRNVFVVPISDQDIHHKTGSGAVSSHCSFQANMLKALKIKEEDMQRPRGDDMKPFPKVDRTPPPPPGGFYSLCSLIKSRV